MTDEELLAALLATLERIHGLIPATKQVWDADETIRLAAERLWIEAGNTTEEYRRAAGIQSAVHPWVELYDYRNLLAHALPGDVNPDRVWHDTNTDLDRLIEEIRHQLGPSTERKG